jgi:uncharacterized membrane protein
MSDVVEPVEPVADSADATAAPKKPALTWHSLVIAGLFGLLYAYFVYQAIGNIIELPKSYDAIGLSDSVPWVLLVIGLFIPVVVYVLAFIIGLRRPVLDKAIIFVMGITITAGLGFTVVAIHRLTFQALAATLLG